MKIVHICLCGPVTDGFTYQDNLLTKYHKKMGLDVSIITSQWIFDNKGELALSNQTDYINEDGVRVIRLPILLGNVTTRLKVFPKLIDTLEAENPDILFIHDPQFLDICRIARYLKGHPDVKTYIDNHVDYSNGASNWVSKYILHSVIWKHCVKRIAPYVEKFYGVLPARVDFLKERYGLPDCKCSLLVMGADDELADLAAEDSSIQCVRAKYKIQKEDFLIVTGGKIDQWKPQTLLLMEAVRNLNKRSSKNFKLIVFGSVVQELQEQFTALVDGCNVQYAGWQNNEEAYRLFAAADLAVFPGHHSVYWEQVCGQGIPMIVRDWAGTHHVDLGGNVRFLQHDSVEEIENQLQEIISNPEEFDEMKRVASEKGPAVFRYSQIARESIAVGGLA